MQTGQILPVNAKITRFEIIVISTRLANTRQFCEAIKEKSQQKETNKKGNSNIEIQNRIECVCSIIMKIVYFWFR